MISVPETETVGIRYQKLLELEYVLIGCFFGLSGLFYSFMFWFLLSYYQKLSIPSMLFGTAIYIYGIQVIGIKKAVIFCVLLRSFYCRYEIEKYVRDKWIVYQDRLIKSNIYVNISKYNEHWNNMYLFVKWILTWTYSCISPRVCAYFDKNRDRIGVGITRLNDHVENYSNKLFDRIESKNKDVANHITTTKGMIYNAGTYIDKIFEYVPLISRFFGLFSNNDDKDKIDETISTSDVVSELKTVHGLLNDIKKEPSENHSDECKVNEDINPPETVIKVRGSKKHRRKLRKLIA